MRRVISFVALAAIVAFSVPALASDPTSNNLFRPVTGEPQGVIHIGADGSRTVTPIGSGGSDRNIKHQSYESLNGVRYYFPAGVNVAVADDLFLDKIPGKDLMNRFEFVYYIYPPYAPNGDTIKIDFYDAFGGGYAPSSGAKIPGLHDIVFDVPAGFYIVSVDLDPALPKPDVLWASIQSIGNGEFGLILNDFLPNIGYSRDLFGMNVDKDNDFNWRFYFFGGGDPNGQGNPWGSFAWAIWNVPEPATMVLLAGSALALIRRRR